MRNSSRIAIIAEGALCAALSVVLSYFTLFRMPQGGSINLSLVPMFVFAYRHGWKWGIEVGILVGFLEMMLRGYVVHPVQAILDYPLAFAVIGFCGIWRKNLPALVTGTILAGLARLACHVVSGVVFFASYAPEGTSVLLYSFIYNAAFFFPQLAANMIVALPVFRRIEKIYPRNRNELAE
ncbi:MAG: energy-coupled thiamine transporter ThiT [Synergistaceae bacterium]|nr:energy-coupled thiamine transporter ThiT [Synergistaceae bacterium]